MKTLMILATHFIDENVISEYRKMKNTPGVDAVLAIDNTNPKIEFKSRVETKIFFDTNVKCFFFDSALHNEFQLHHFIENGEQNFKKNMYENGDYRFYYFRKYFPDYDYYWMIDYDVFCNAENYAGFLEKFADNRADLLIQGLAETKKSDEGFHKNLDWLYNDEDKIYQGLFAVVRLSARAIDFLYRKRLEQTKLFKNSLYIDNSYFGLWSLIANIIIYVLNKTIKPLIVWLTIPITALTLGLFYPFINVLILNIVSFILGNHFIIEGGLLMTFIIAIFISLMNLIMKNIIEKILKEVKK